jgi:predicted metalloprotease
MFGKLGMRQTGETDHDGMFEGSRRVRRLSRRPERVRHVQTFATQHANADPRGADVLTKRIDKTY